MANALLLATLVAAGGPVTARSDPGGTAAPTELPIAGATTRKLDVPVAGGGGVGGSFVRCGRGKRVVTGGAFWHRPGEGHDLTLPAYIGSSAPTANGRRWFAAGINWSGDELLLRIIAWCLPASDLGPYIVKLFELDVAAKSVASHDRRCPQGSRLVTGGAFWSRGDGAPLPSVKGYLRGSTPDPDGKGWWAAGWNDGGDALRLVLIALCLPGGTVGPYVYRTFVETVGAVLDAESEVGCGAGRRALPGGASWHFPGSKARKATIVAWIKGSAPIAGGKRWYASGLNAETQDLGFRVNVLCVPT